MFLDKYIDFAWHGQASYLKGPVNSRSKSRLLHVENIIQGSYVCLGLLLITVVYLSIHFRNASSYASSPDYSVLEDREQQLAGIRKFSSQGVTSIRDFLINNNPNSAEVYEDEVRRSKSSSTKAFLALNGWPEQRFVLAQMDRDLADFWSLLDEARDMPESEKAAHGYSLVHEQIIPGRREVGNSLKLLEDRNALDRKELMARYAKVRQNDLTALFSTMAAIILISLLLASGNQKFRRDSQAESRRKIQEIVHARDSLEQLSGRLLRIQEEERRKISRELHDGIGQTLTALRMEIHQVHLIAGGGEERLIRARKLAEEAVHTVKDISLLLRPPLLDDLGLEPALAWLTEQFSRRTGIKCRFRANNLQEQLPDDLRTCAFRVIQEAIHNCEKHAAPTEVQISLDQTCDSLNICIEDDGAGFVLTENNTPAMQAGLGILGMRERALLLGGTLKIESAPGLGTKLIMMLPVVKLSFERDTFRFTHVLQAQALLER